MKYKHEDSMLSADGLRRLATDWRWNLNFDIYQESLVVIEDSVE